MRGLQRKLIGAVIWKGDKGDAIFKSGRGGEQGREKENIVGVAILE